MSKHWDTEYANDTPEDPSEVALARTDEDAARRLVPIPFGTEASRETRRAAIRHNAEALLARVAPGPDGRPCVLGRRGPVKVALVLELLAYDVPGDELAEQYELELDDIRACLMFAGQMTRAVSTRR